MDYNYSVNHEDNFQDESAEIIGYCAICDCEIKTIDKYYHFNGYDMICPSCVENNSSIAQCETCGTYFIVKDMAKYQSGSEVHYYCNEHLPK